MEVAIVTTIVGAVVSTALQEAVRRINNRRVTTSVASIEECNTRVSQEIKMYEQRHKDRSVAWRDKIAELRRLSCNIEDCIDKFNIKKLTSEKFATEIKTIETALKQQSDELEAYIQQDQGSSSGSSQGQHENPNHAGPDLVGIEEPRNDLLALVLGNSNNQQAQGNPEVMKVISIVGFGGVGKTCLAAEVYSCEDVAQSFQLRAFVRATGMNKDGVVQKVVHQLGANLRSANQRCLIVVDDVQDEKLGSDVISLFRTATTVDGIIIMTTTVQSFAESWSCDGGHVYKMRPLSVELSGRLFRGHCPSVDDDVQKSKEVGKKCDGVPLAVITWARYWNGDPQRCETVWSQFGDPNLSERLERMAEVLKHSYDGLPSIDLQTCLLYFSMFRREHPIRRGSLIRRWQAEGSEVGCDNLTNNHIPASKNWKMLVDRNVVCPIQVSINGDHGAKTCRPSGAMLGYISQKSRREGFARVCSDEACTRQGIRRLSLQTNNADVLEDETAVSCLRTLVVSPENTINAADLSLNNCQLLRVLDLEACSSPERISIVEKVCNKLKLLRYLSLRSASIHYIPQEITQLQWLETLDVGKDDKVVVVHVDIMLLPKLKHLIGKFKLKTSWPFYNNKRKFEARRLETLAGFVTLGGNGFPRLMRNMRNMRKVKVFFDPEASAKSLSSRLAVAITAFLRGSADPHITLSIDTQECKQTSDVLRSLENANGRLYSLKLCGTSNLPGFPLFIGNLNGIQKLCISFDTLPWQDIVDGQRYLPDLKYLKLVAKDSFIGVSKQHIAGQSTVTKVLLINGDQFKKLERMCLQSAQILPKIEIQGGALTKLVSLHLISGGIIGRPTEVICNSDSTNGSGHATAVICNSNSANQIPPVQNQNEVADKIPPLKNLKEVALQSSSPVDDDIKKAWHRAARGHPKSPQVLFIEDPHNA